MAVAAFASAGLSPGTGKRGWPNESLERSDAGQL